MVVKDTEPGAAGAAGAAPTCGWRYESRIRLCSRSRTCRNQGIPDRAGRHQGISDPRVQQAPQAQTPGDKCRSDIAVQGRLHIAPKRGCSPRALAAAGAAEAFSCKGRQAHRQAAAGAQQGAPPGAPLAPRKNTHRPRELGRDLLRLVGHGKLVQLHVQLVVCAGRPGGGHRGTGSAGWVRQPGRGGWEQPGKAAESEPSTVSLDLQLSPTRSWSRKARLQTDNTNLQRDSMLGQRAFRRRRSAPLSLRSPLPGPHLHH